MKDFRQFVQGYILKYFNRFAELVPDIAPDFLAGKGDAVLLEGITDSLVGFAADIEPALICLRQAPHAQHHVEFLSANHAARYDRLDNMYSLFGIGQQL
jgi:hypothetical protein